MNVHTRLSPHPPLLPALLRDPSCSQLLPESADPQLRARSARGQFSQECTFLPLGFPGIHFRKTRLSAFWSALAGSGRKKASLLVAIPVVAKVVTGAQRWGLGGGCGAPGLSSFPPPGETATSVRVPAHFSLKHSSPCSL